MFRCIPTMDSQLQPCDSLPGQTSWLPSHHVASGCLSQSTEIPWVSAWLIFLYSH